MSQRPQAVLTGLGGLLALYLCAPLLACVPQVAGADWAGIDLRALGGAVGISAATNIDWYKPNLKPTSAEAAVEIL